MTRHVFSILIQCYCVMTVAMGISGSACAAPPPPAYTPPGPGSVNPPLQPDGIQVPDVFGTTGNWQFSPPLRKFVDSLAPLGCSSTNNIGQCIPVAIPDTTTFNGSDYYEIELNRYTSQMHSDLPPTTLQGYRQVNGPNGTNRTQHFLGPIIVAQKNRPVRIKFINKLPLESVEPFFLPVDTTVMGSGMGPLTSGGASCNPVYDPRLGETKPDCAEYTKNRAELHLHGGLNPWISDGTPHQWITPAGEATVYPKASNVQYVPDMWFDASGNVITSCAGQTTCGVPGASTNPGPGAQTYYYTNQQSARMMFYHDHSFGITRLNVYAGEAAGYLIRDAVEQKLIDTGIIPGTHTDGSTVMGGEIPLVIEDKTFVDATPGAIDTLDPTWVWGTGPRAIQWVDSTGAAITACNNLPACGTPGARKKLNVTPKTGDLWWPHVYMPAENPADLGGVNAMGRWVYGLYFWPPTTGIKFLPVANPFYDCGPTGLCDSPWEPPTMPATPNPSWTAEAFLDTQTVNGTVFPKLDLQPKTYRLRILNASHDRFVNLQLYQADATVDANAINPLCTAQKPCALNTEVKMVPAVEYPAYPDWSPAADNRAGGVPDPATAGPKWIQIGNEGGFLPTPAIINNKPISFVLDPTLFNVGNVNDGTLIMGPAERADVIIDFSAYAGKTLILYNDAPAAFPAFVPNNDYYTDAPDLRDVGGYPGTRAGTGPNTRTIMQINVAPGTGTPFNETALMSAFTSAPGTPSVFQQAQHPVIVGQSAYNSAYNTIFPSTAPNWGLSGIADQTISFETIADPLTSAKELTLQYPMQPKALHDEMGAVWDEYGRMSAKLGVELPNTNNINQIFVMQNYQDPPTELVQDGKVQLWKITHNGVDTHPLHFHLFDVQVINRVGWDGFIRLPWENELGWKETVRVSPLEDTIVALRPRAPVLPYALPDSERLYQPALPVNSPEGFMNLNPLDGQAITTLNISHNYGAEYVWHCHILSHEEQDMMRPLEFRVATAASGDPTGLTISPSLQSNTLSWTDTTYNVAYDRTIDIGPYLYNTTLGFTIERCIGNETACNAGAGTFTEIGRITMVSNSKPSYTDDTIVAGQAYTYRVKGYNTWVDNTTPSPTWHTGPADPLATTAAMYGSAAAVVANPATSVTLDAYIPVHSAAPAKFYAQGIGGTGNYQYRFFLDNVLVQDYSATRYWSIPQGTTPGLHNVQVDVRTNFSSATPDQTNSLPYTIDPSAFAVTFTADANGSITAGTTSQIVNWGATATPVTAAPVTPGYHFINWTDANNNVVGTNATLALANVQSVMAVRANFINTFAVNFFSNGNGTVDPLANRSQNVLINGNANQVTATPATGSYFVNWTGTGGFITTTSNPLTVTNVTADQDIVANFAYLTNAVNFVIDSTGGLIGNIAQTVNYGAAATAVTAVPTIPGYHFVNWTGTGGFITTTANPLIVTNVTATQTITAHFAIDTFAVNFVSGDNGHITGNSAQTVYYGAAATAVTAVPTTPGYSFVNWTGTGGFSTTTANPLTVTNVTAPQTITANFAIVSVNVSMGSGVTGPATIAYGGSATYTITAPTGYTVQDVTVNGVSIGAETSYTVVNALVDQTILATFSIQSFDITMSPGVSGPATVAYGSLPTYQFAVPGFNVVDVKINGVTVGAVSSYTYTSGINANQTISVSYAASSASATPLRVMHAGVSQDVSTLQAAYNAAADGDTILIQAGAIAGPLLANKAINVTIKGGYEATYQTALSPSLLQGLSTLQTGTVRAVNISIQ